MIVFYLLAWWQRYSTLRSVNIRYFNHTVIIYYRGHVCALEIVLALLQNMASTSRAPKQWYLTKIETVNTFENWRQNLLYTLSLDKNFALFLITGSWWDKKTKNTPFRGFADDDESIPEGIRLIRMQKVNILELMLGQIANYCPVISRNKIVKNSTSVDKIWQTIRLHYGFQTTGAHFIDFDSIRYDPSERPEDLFQRLTAFVEDIHCVRILV